MLLRHATPVSNLDSIRKHGLRIAYAKGRNKAVWLHALSKSAWAVLHTKKRHHTLVEDVVVLEVRVPRGWCKKSGKTGLWYCPRDIPADRIVGQIDFDQLAASPVEEPNA